MGRFILIKHENGSETRVNAYHIIDYNKNFLFMSNMTGDEHYTLAPGEYKKLDAALIAQADRDAFVLVPRELLEEALGDLERLLAAYRDWREALGADETTFERECAERIDRINSLLQGDSI
jgi:hypothetical protein